jgi:hypothetical protein
MLANVGIVYDYLFKDHPRNFFGWLKLSTQGAQQWGHLSGTALRVAQNISKLADYFQIGGDIPVAFQSFRVVYDKYQEYEPTPSSAKPLTQVPVWVEVCQAVNNAAFLTGFSREHIFNQPHSSLADLIGIIADFLESSYDFHSFVSQWQKKFVDASTHIVSPIPKEKFQAKRKFSFQKLSMLSWNIQNIAQLVHMISHFVLIALSVIALYQGIDDYSPKATIVFTTTYLSSHLIFYYNSHIKLKIRKNYH